MAEERKAEAGQGDSDQAQGTTAPPSSAKSDTQPAETLELGSAVTFRSPAEAGDAYAEVVIADDCMSVIAQLHPPAETGKPLGSETLAELLARLGVSHGVLWDEIGEALMRCNLERIPVRNLVIARGSLPVDEVPAHAELEPRFRKSGPLTPTDASRVDYKQLSSLTVVKKGETLARVFAKVEGQPGIDVRGRETPFARRSVESFVPGKNASLVDDRIEASVDGLLAVNGQRLDIEEILIVKGDVDYHTGHIVFPGDVVLEGRVGDGFKVWSGGSIVCKSTLDAFDVNAKKNLLCAQGVIGRRQGHIRVGGEFRARFVQNCKLAARGDVLVATAIVGSRVYSLGKVDLGDKGVVMGGEVFAVHGLRTGRIGNEAHQRTVIHVGTDFTVQQQLDQANERLRALSLKARKAAEAAAQRPSPGLARLREELDKAMVELSSMIGRLLLALDADEDALVEAYGDIFPGVVIEICRIRIEIDEPLKSCRFRLDKAAGRIVTERLGKGPGAQASTKPQA